MEEEETEVTIIGFIGLPPPTPDGKENPDNTPNATRSFCEICGKPMINTRCELHIKAVGCHYCHLVKEHMEPISA